MYTYKITKLESAYSQADHNYFIDLEADIYEVDDNGEVVVSDEEVGGTHRPIVVCVKKFGYSLDTDKDTILADLEKVCATMASDEIVAADSAELEKNLAAVAVLKEDLIQKE